MESQGRSCALSKLFPNRCKKQAARSSGVVPKIKLNDGHEMPAFGLGTWLGLEPKSGSHVEMEGNEVRQSVEWAVDAGYRNFDTAAIYNTEVQLGKGISNKIADGTIKREDVFIATKLWNDAHARDAVVPALRESLRKLNMDYVDLYLMHWPIAHYANGTFQDADYVDAWAGMVEARELGLARSIGVCNFNLQQLQRLASLSPVTPASLQVEMNLNIQQPQLLEYCRQHGIIMTGYTPFGALFGSKVPSETPPPQPRVDSPELVAIARKYNKTVPQVVLRYEVELGVVPIPKSTSKARIEQNIDIFDFELSAEDRAALAKFDVGFRSIPVKFWVDSPYYPFEKPTA